MLKFSKLPKIELGGYWLAIFLATYITVFLNDQLWFSLLKTQTSFSASVRWQFIWVIGIALVAAQSIVFLFLLWSRILKPLSLLILLSAIGANYFANNYGVHFDSSMLRNIFATNFLEAKELITTSLIIEYLKHLPLILFITLFLNVLKKNLK